MNDPQPLRDPPTAGEPVVQPRRSERSGGILAEIPKTYLALGVVIGIFGAGVALRDTLKGQFLSEAKATTDQRARDDGQDKNLHDLQLEVREVRVELQYVKRGLEWGNDRIYEQARREGANPPAPPESSPVQTPAIGPAITPTNRPR